MAKIIFRVLSKAQTELQNKIRGYNDKSEWDIHSKRFVAFLDILGFKEMVLRNSHIDVFEKLKAINSVNLVVDQTFEDKNSRPLKVITFSDSIIIFSKNDSLETYSVFLDAVNWIMSEIIGRETAVKGAVAHGLISVDEESSVFFGNPFIDAYLLQEDVDYMGIVAHHSIDSYHKSLDESDLKKEIENAYVETTSILKSGKIKHLNLDYFPFIVYDKIDDMDEKLNSFKLSMSGKPRKYLENTFSFLNEYKKLKEN